MFKRIISLTLTIVLCLSACPAHVFAATGFGNFVYAKVYEGQFRDVPDTAWYAESVAEAYELDLVAGTSPTTFNPEGNLKLSEVVTLAAQLHSRYYGKPIPKVSSGPWYQTYIDYALSNGILYVADTDFDRAATRAEYVFVLARCFPESGYAQINDIEDGEIPDVSMSTPYAEAVYKFYRAGIMQGFAGGEFRPTNYIRRCEIAATLLRLADPAIRGEFSLKGEEEYGEEEYEDEDYEDSGDLVSDGIFMYENTEEHIVSGKITYSGGSYEAEYYDDELIVAVNGSMDEEDVDAMMEPYGGVSLGYIKPAGIYQIVFEDSKTMSELNSIMAAVKKHSGVKDAYLNTIGSVQFDANLYSSDPWGADLATFYNENIPDGNRWGYEAVFAGTARQMVINRWGNVEDVPKITIGVIDQFFLPHPDLTYAGIMSGNEFVSIDTYFEKNGVETTNNLGQYGTCIHGTHVSGTICAKQNNHIGISGIAINTDLFGYQLYKKDYSVTEIADAPIPDGLPLFYRQTAAGLLICNEKNQKNQPIIINYSGYDHNELSKDYEIYANCHDGKIMGRMLNALLEAGYDYLIVTSAGNRKNHSHDAAYNNAYTAISRTDYPDVYDRILVVGAADRNFCFADHLNYGKRIDVVAPGIGIYSTASLNRNYAKEEPYYVMDGTSMAAPHAAGVAALVLAADPTLHGDDLKRIIAKTANIELANPDKKDDDTDGTYHNMVNAAYAVSSALGKTYTIGSDKDSPVKWSLSEDGKLTIINGADLKEYAQNGKHEWSRWASNISSVVFVGDTTAIGPGTFTGCRNLERITIPETVTRIDGKAISGNSSLKSITILNKSEYPDLDIADDAIFENAEGLILYGWKGSAVEEYANAYYDKEKKITNAEQYGFTFVPLDEDTGHDPSLDPAEDTPSIHDKGSNRVVAVSCGDDFTAAILEDGSLWTWGCVSIGVYSNWLTPRKISEDVVSVSCGYSYAAFVKSDGSLWVNGFNSFYGTWSQNATKVMDDVAAVSCYPDTDSVMTIIKKDRSLWTWGYNSKGQLGNGTTTHTETPVKIMDNVIAASPGSAHAAAIRQDKTLWTWGGVGDNTADPVRVMDNAIAVCCGGTFFEAIKADHSLWGWGNNSFGQLGIKTDDYNPTEPLKILDNVIDVSCGWDYTAVILEDGSLWTFGNNIYGQLGTGDEIKSAIPVKVMDDVVSVKISNRHTAAIKSDGTLWMWGRNNCGQLGNGTMKDSSVPVQVIFPGN